MQFDPLLAYWNSAMNYSLDSATVYQNTIEYFSQNGEIPAQLNAEQTAFIANQLVGDIVFRLVLNEKRNQPITNQFPRSTYAKFL